MTPTEPLDLKTYLQQRKRRVDDELGALFPQEEGPAADLLSSQRYSLMAGGKRLRPILCMAGAAAVGGSEEDVLPAACALECIHTYSLIHDDLPFMDDDDLRRGQPTNHKVFGEAIALLAGDGLLTEAFRILARPGARTGPAAEKRLEAIALIAGAAGCRGMVAGQVVDIQSEGQSIELDTLEYIHSHKTAALIRAAVLSGAILGGGTAGQCDSLSTYGHKIGLAFQIADDILDIEGEQEKLGKPTGADQARGKATYPALMGLKRSKDLQNELIAAALYSLSVFDQRAEPLQLIARYIITRSQ